LKVVVDVTRQTAIIALRCLQYCAQVGE